MTWKKFLPWNNSYFQLSIITVVVSGGLMALNLGSIKINVPNPLASILTHPPSPSDLAQAQQDYSQGETALNAGNYDAAILAYTQAITLNPKYTDALLERGRAYDNKGNQDMAIQDDSQIISIDPTYKMAFNNRGYAYYEKNNYSQAVTDYSKAIDLDSNFAMAYDNRATANYMLGNEAQSLQDYMRGFQLNANCSDCYAGAAWILATSPVNGLRNGHQAMEYVNKAGELTNWKDPELKQTVAAANAEIGNFDTAINIINQYLNTPNLTQNAIADGQKQLAAYQARTPYHRSSN